MIITLNKNNYLKLLTETKIIPKLIETEIEYEEYLAWGFSLNWCRAQAQQQTFFLLYL